ncbi:hypothetical protein [Dysgonomonas sp. ZJ279]|uniref:hypothetical protein n=1 Tax=Dysgonomonas sp. ZJ279 TaxID=2709796 RepID=UPI0013EB6D5A|nr:hypothetical protein [Dysgonomonas sp. ZJ279]
MNAPDTEITLKGIIVIQSLKDSERKTGDELNNDILQYNKYMHADSFVKFYNVKTIREFTNTLNLIQKQMSKGEIFTLHLETHGSEDGIHLASGECLKWTQFFNSIRPINIKMSHLLIIVMAMCKGVAILSCIEPEKRAPYRAFIGAHRDITEDEVARGFSAFYSSYTNMLDIVEGMKALDIEIDGENSGSKTFWCFSAERTFDATFNPDRDPKHFNKIVTEQFFNHIIKGETHYTWAQVEYNLRNFFKETSDQYRDYYCFKDVLK